MNTCWIWMKWRNDRTVFLAGLTEMSAETNTKFEKSLKKTIRTVHFLKRIHIDPENRWKMMKFPFGNCFRLLYSVQWPQFQQPVSPSPSVFWKRKRRSGWRIWGNCSHGTSQGPKWRWRNVKRQGFCCQTVNFVEVSANIWKKRVEVILPKNKHG